MKKVLVTGINGLLGTNLANELLDQGNFIWAIVRDPSKYMGKRTANLKLIQMDLWGNYGPYLKETDIVVHIAAETATNLIAYADYEKVNYEATVRLFEMAKKQNVSQFIFISTANTIGYGCLTHLGTESQKIKRPFSKLHYAKSKLTAENYVLTNRQGIDLKILNPTFMIGPYDSKPSSGKIILMGLNKKVVFYPPGGKNFVPVKDVVSAIANSFHNGKSGEKYLIAGENMSYYDFFKKMKQVSAQKQLLIPLPIPLLKTIGLMGNALRLFNIKTSLGSSNMETLYIKNYYSNQKSIQELKLRYSPIDTAIKEAIGYFEQKNIPNQSGHST